MRLALLYVGVDAADFLIVDAFPGASPLPAYSHTAELRLGEYSADGNRLSRDDARRLEAFASGVINIANDKGVEEFLGFATSAFADVAGGAEMFASIRERTGIEIRTLTEENEARLIFLATHRWCGWSSGRLLTLTIGRASLGIAAGANEEPDVALSLRLGTGPLTRDWLTSDPPSDDEVRVLRRHIRAEIARRVGDITRDRRPSRVVASHEMSAQLALLSGAERPADGLYRPWLVSHHDVQELSTRLAQMTDKQRRRLPGVSGRYTRELVTGALIADATLDLFGLRTIEVCPWGLREGVILRRLDVLAS
jgi:exopolyphosphatase/guanosine-5'-triphosphate,3'-diphosphate pyrophosphatase